MIVSGGIRNISMHGEKENAVSLKKNNTATTSPTIPSFMPQSSSTIKQKSYVSSAAPRKALGDVTNKSSLPSLKDKKATSTSTPLSTLLFVPGSHEIKKKVSAGKPKITSIITPKVVVKEKIDIKPPHEPSIVFDPMYPQPPVPLAIGAKLSDKKIQSLVMAPLIEFPSDYSYITQEEEEEEEDNQDINMFNSFSVPEMSFNFNDPCPSPPSTDYEFQQDSSSSDNGFSYSDYYKEMIM